jgi:iron(III) transport system substrate-binding protein
MIHSLLVRRLVGLLVMLTGLCSYGCKRENTGGQSAQIAGPVVLYTSVDEPYVRPLVEQFKRETGIDVTLVTDAEASKSVGLAEKLRAEKDHPNADVWWSNECFLTINLADEDVLAPYESPSAADVPAQFKDPQHRWAGSVLRVRTMVAAPGHGFHPTGLSDFLRPEVKGRIAIARPTAGTTGGHVAALYVLWGNDRADDFFRKLHTNGVILVGGNSMVAETVARGDLWLGLCDNDDAADASTNVGKLEAVLPDQGDGQDGTLGMPCTVGLVNGSPHPEAARKLIDFLLSSRADQKLIDAKFAWCSVRDASGKGKFMKVDYTAVAHTMPAAIRAATFDLEGRKE